MLRFISIHLFGVFLMKEKIMDIVLNAVALGMGVSTIVMSILGVTIPIGMLLGIGVACLGLYGLNKQ